MFGRKSEADTLPNDMHILLYINKNMSLSNIYQCHTKVEITKPVLSGHLWDKEKWLYKTGNLLKYDQFIKNVYSFCAHSFCFCAFEVILLFNLVFRQNIMIHFNLI